MHPSGGFLETLALVLGVAALTTVVFQRLRQPVVLGYLLAGLLVGPHVGIVPTADLETVRTLSELGIILLMFSLGLDFSIGKLLRLGPRMGVIGAVEMGLLCWLGFVAGRLFGWGVPESVFAGAIVSISSTMIVAKCFAEVNVDHRTRELVLGILVIEDIVAIAMIATLTAVASGQGVTAGAFAMTSLKLAGFLVVLVATGLLVVPRFLGWVVRSGHRETSLVATVGCCFVIALLAQRFGYSVGLGAFLAGALAAESGHGQTIEHMIRPLKDLFAAVFFVSVGMLIDPVLILAHWEAIVVLTAIVMTGKVVGVSLGGVLAGHSVQESVRAGMSLTQIGEFSFLFAAIALTMEGSGSFLYPVAVSVSVITSFTTPYFVRASERFARAVERRVPHSLQTFLTLYGTWLSGARDQIDLESFWGRLRRLVLLTLADAGLLVGVAIAGSIGRPRLAKSLESWTGLAPDLGETLVVALTLLAASPFLIGILRCVRNLGILVGGEILPASGKGEGDSALAAQRSLILGLQLAIFLAVGVPVLAIAQPFLPPLPGAGVLFFALLVAAILFWKGTAGLDKHVRAGSVMIAEVLAQKSRRDTVPVAIDQVSELLPGLGQLTPVAVEEVSAAVGRSLVEIDLRGRTGATVVFIKRGDRGVTAPSGDERIQAGDVLLLSGSEGAIRSARTALARRDLETMRSPTAGRGEPAA